MTFIEDHFLLAEDSPMGKPMIARAIREKKVFYSNDAQNDPKVRFKQEHVERGTRSLAILSLPVSDEAVGVLVLHTEEAGCFDEDELKLLTELAGDISFALDRIEKAHKLDYVAYYDSLTGVANRTLYLERLKQNMRPAGQAGSKLALVLCDVERLRTINESLGRPARDALLKQAAERLALAAGRTEVGRISADQFAVVPAAAKGRSHVGRMLQTILRNCFGEPFRIDDSALRLSAKAGIAMFPHDGADAETLLGNAEAALRKCKETGEPSVFYTQAFTERTTERLTLANKLRTALRDWLENTVPGVSVLSAGSVEDALDAPAQVVADAMDAGAVAFASKRGMRNELPPVLQAVLEKRRGRARGAGPSGGDRP